MRILRKGILAVLAIVILGLGWIIVSDRMAQPAPADTAPLIAKPLTPLLIGAFAFNFNNFVLISLLTDGRPDYLNTVLPAGQTDILVSYTYRIAFRDSGQDFGLAAAISTVIFFMVALMSMANLRLMRNSQK